jgi:hypothetical protein
LPRLVELLSFVQEQGDVRKAVAIDISSWQNLGSLVDIKRIVVIQIVRQDRLRVSAEFYAYGGEGSARINRDEITVTIAIEIANRAQ